MKNDVGLGDKETTMPAHPNQNDGRVFCHLFRDGDGSHSYGLANLEKPVLVDALAHPKRHWKGGEETHHLQSGGGQSITPNGHLASHLTSIITTITAPSLGTRLRCSYQ